jgi:hypothetical protein
MGWVSELARQGKTLVAKFSQVQPELEALAASGRYPNRSAAFYTDPQGKGPVLRHVGFLGAVPPEVKGLAPIRFSSEQFTSIDFQEEITMPEKTFKEQFVEFFGELLGKKQDAPTFSEGQVKDLISGAVGEVRKEFTEQIKSLKDENKSLRDQIGANSASSLKAKAVTFVERMKAAGKWLPAWDRQGVPAILENLAVSGQTVKFGEAGKETEVNAFDQMCAFYEGLAQVVPTDPVMGKHKTSSGKVIHFNESKGVALDVASVALNERAEQIAKDQKISFAEALPLAAQELSA